MDKKNVVYTHNGILFSLKKEGNSDTRYNINELWTHYAKWNKPDTEVQILYDSIYMSYLESWYRKYNREEQNKAGKISEEIMERNFSNLVEDINLQNQ